MSVLFFLLLIFSYTSLVSSDNDDENELLKMKKQLGDPDFLSSWVKGFEYCRKGYQEPAGGYIYIECTNVTSGRVRFITMVGLRNISAPFPDAICSLKELDSIEIITVLGFYGPIPSCITKLSNLSHFQIILTSLSGSMPEFHYQTNLTYINLSYNQLSGTIPSSLSSLPNLQFLDLSSNHLTGTIPSSLSTLQNIYHMDLSSNYLTGSIPPGLFHNSYPKPPYTFLLLSNNNLTGEIPKCIGTADLTRLDVKNNQLSGDASFLFGKQKRADVIILANNDFEFDLSYVEFSDKLMTLDISHNKIYGKVPDSIINATSLYFPNFSFNKLCGELPQGGNMKQMNFRPDVFANNSCLCGSPLPPC